VVGEITVTAQKREEDIQDVPVAISTLSGEDLQNLAAGAPDVRVLSGRVPSLVMESSFGRAFPRFYIRGLGNTDFDLNASQPVSMVVDEVVLENPIVKGVPLFDLERVEVLRGPQGTLFGRNTPAGVVKFETVKPSQEFDSYLRASYSSFDTIDINGAVGGPLSETVSARFSGLYQTRSNWSKNQYELGPQREMGQYENMAWRAQLLWEPNEKFSALINVHGWEVNDGTSRMFHANILKPGGGIVDWFEFDKFYYDGLNDQNIGALGGVLRLEYDFGAATLTSITGFESIDDMLSRGDIDGGNPTGPGTINLMSETADGIPSLDQWTQELRVASNGGGTFDWLVGLFYFSEDLSALTYSYNSAAPGNPVDGLATQEQEAEAYALFGSLDFHLSDAWDLKVGLRYSSDDKDFSADRPIPPYQPPLVAPITRQVDGSNVSWDLSAIYKVSETFNFYARAATGYRAPSIQGRILFQPDFDGGTNPATDGVSVADEETIVSVEAGIKTILAENRLRFNLTGYVFEVSDQQVSAVGGEFNTATLLNAEKAEGYGLETDIEWTPSGNWLMRFGASYNPTKMNDPNLTVGQCGGGCTILDPIVDGNVLVDGNPLPHAPEFIFNGIINFRSDPALKKWFGVLDFLYQSEKNFFLYESAEFKDDAFEVGLRFGYAWNQAKYEVALFSRNVFEAKIVRGGIDFSNLVGFTNDPRIIGIEFLGRF
jgi:iron complex outermembrane receptor protein